MRRGIAIALVTVLLGGGVLWFALESAVDRAALPPGLDDPPPATTVLEDIRGREIAVIPNATARECHPIPLEEAGKWLVLATVGIEDHRYWDHDGVDLHAATGAAVRNVRNQRIISGASTITEQLVKLASGRTERKLGVKIREAITAMRLEREWSKRRILENYLNRIDYGNRRFGAQAAALAYFGKPAKDLTLSEAIYLAGLPQSPAWLNPWNRPERAVARYKRNVQRLAREGLLPEGADVAAMLKAPPRVTRREPPGLAPYFTQLVRVPAGAKRVRTTLDLDLQKTVEKMLREHLASVGGSGVGDAAVVVLDNASGEVRALACAGRPEQAGINSAMEPRSCGSTLKPFLYLVAIDQRTLTAASLLPDTAEAITGEYRDYDPQNYSQRHLGPVRVREALGNSLNVPAVVALSRLGARETFDGMRRWGLNFPGNFDAYGAGFILGNAPVRLVELGAAYASMARGGEAWKAKFTPAEAIESRRAGSREACAIVSDMLCDNEARMQSFGNASPLNVGPRTAAKTGTSSGFRDGWCAGFNGTHTVAVWAGNLNGRSMGEVLAVRSAAPLWAGVMRHLYAQGDATVPELKESERLKTVNVAAETGLLPRMNEKTVREWFLAGTAPTDEADTWYADGVLQLPEEYAGWCASPQNRLGAKVREGRLEILFPREGAVFVKNPNLPPSQQMLPVKGSRDGCEWFLNGRRLKSTLIPLEKGDWVLTARGGGEEVQARYSVQ